MENKNVLVFNLTPRMGMLHYSSQFCNELSKHLKTSVVIADYYNGFLYDEGIDVINIKATPSPKAFIFETLAIWRHWKLFQSIRKINPDIVHFIDNHPWYIPYSFILKWLGFTIYVTQHDPITHSGETHTLLGKIATLTNKVLAKNSDKLILHSEEFRPLVASMHHIPVEKIISVPHGAYTFFTKWKKNLPIEENSFLFFGRIVDYKGLDLLLESLYYVKNECPEFKLVIAGSGDIVKYQPLLEKYSENILLNNREIADEDVYKYFESCEFVVLPYKDATASGVIPVAYGFGKAVLATNVGALSHFVENGKTGYLVEPNNVKLFGEKIVEMLKNKEVMVEMGKNGREFSDEKLGWREIIEKIY